MGEIPKPDKPIWGFFMSAILSEHKDLISLLYDDLGHDHCEWNFRHTKPHDLPISHMCATTMHENP